MVRKAKRQMGWQLYTMAVRRHPHGEAVVPFTTHLSVLGILKTTKLIKKPAGDTDLYKLYALGILGDDIVKLGERRQVHSPWGHAAGAITMSTVMAPG